MLEKIPKKLLVIFSQLMILVTVCFMGLIIGEFFVRRDVFGISMTNSQMETYLANLPSVGVALARELADLEAEISQLKAIHEQMEYRITHASKLDFQAREQEIEEANRRNSERRATQISEIKGVRDEQIQELEALYEEINRLRALIQEVQP